MSKIRAGLPRSAGDEVERVRVGLAVVAGLATGAAYCFWFLEAKKASARPPNPPRMP